MCVCVCVRKVFVLRIVRVLHSCFLSFLVYVRCVLFFHASKNHK
jgi:hypothetical protein